MVAPLYTKVVHSTARHLPVPGLAPRTITLRSRASPSGAVGCLGRACARSRAQKETRRKAGFLFTAMLQIDQSTEKLCSSTGRGSGA